MSKPIPSPYHFQRVLSLSNCTRGKTLVENFGPTSISNGVVDSTARAAVVGAVLDAL
jgi:hypothetical protein